MAGAVGPGRTVRRQPDTVGERAELFTGDGDDVADCVRKPLPASPRSFDRREHRAEIERKAVGILVMLAASPQPTSSSGERLISAIELAPVEHETVLALDLQASTTADFTSSIEKSPSNRRMNGPSDADALLSLALPSSSAERPSTSRRLTSLPSVGADDAAGARRYHRRSPARDCSRSRSDAARLSAPKPTEAMGWHLVKISASGPMPTSRYCDQTPRSMSLALIAGGFGRARLQLRQVMADQRGDVGADGFGLLGRAPRLFLDDALKQRGNEGDARRFHRLQIDRREQIRLLRIARGRRSCFSRCRQAFRPACRWPTFT